MVNQIKQSEIIQTGPIVISQRNEVPPDLLGVEVDITETEVSDEITLNEDVDLIEDNSATIPEEIPEQEETEELVPVPQSFTIFSQKVNVGPDGRATVDVVIEVEDMPGIVDYEVREAML